MTSRMSLAAAFLALLLVVPASAVAATDCSEAAGSAAAQRSRSAWADWCVACGGTVETGPTCKQGPNWGGGSTAGSSGSSALIEQSVQYGTQTGDVGGAMLGVGVGVLLDGLLKPSAPKSGAPRKTAADLRAEAAQAEAAERMQVASGQQARLLAQLKMGDEADVVRESAAGGCGASAACYVQTMNALGRRLEWSLDEQNRLDRALNELYAIDTSAFTDAQIAQAWQTVQLRGPDPALVAAAERGDGPGLAGASAGTQSFQDCAVFALANAAGLPYGVVASRAGELVRDGEWRSAEDRSNPQAALENRGLIGGEVIMLAESFGQAQVVPRADFEMTLKAKRPVIINVVPQNGAGGHAVVLTKTFEHAGHTWFEVVDSNQGPMRKLYWRADELDMVLQEDGVSYRPERGTVAPLLR